jgi:hypothetical protein
MAIPSDIRSIELAISDWKGVKLHLGDGVVETVYYGYELDFGLWVAQGSCGAPDNLHPLEKTFIHESKKR